MSVSLVLKAMRCFVLRDPRGCPGASLVAIVLLVISGCDQVESIVDDVKSEVGSSSEPAAAPVVAPVDLPTAPVELPQTPAPLDPAQLIAEFGQLKSFEISDGALQKLADVPEAAAQITELDVRGSQVSLSAAGLMLLAKFPNLQSLNVAGRSLTAEAIDAIGQQTMLRELDLSGSPVDPTVAASLSGLSHLQVLRADGTSGGDAVAAAVSSLPLEVLSLSATPLNDAGLQEIAKIQTLKELNVAQTQVTGQGFQALKGHRLVKLNASATRFGVEGLTHLRGMRSLEELHLHAAQIVEGTKAKVFTTMPDLRILNLGSNQISGQGMHESFKGLRNLEELYLHVTDVNDYGLSALVANKKLKLVDVVKTRCSLRGAQELKKRLPECTIRCDGGTI
jgi:Leucine-rich repeat (LRR) protein